MQIRASRILWAVVWASLALGHPEILAVRSAFAQSVPTDPALPEQNPAAPEIAKQNPPQSSPSYRSNRGLVVGGSMLCLVGAGLTIPGAIVYRQADTQMPPASVQRDLVGVPLLSLGGISLSLGVLAILFGVGPVRD